MSPEPRACLKATTPFLAGGRVLAFYPAVEHLHLWKLARVVLGVSDEVAGHFVALVLN